jgi:hypothetical protein
MLGQIATDKTIGTDLRIALAGALARMHTQQSLPYLAQLLSDPNSALQAMAVGGISNFANNVPIGEHEPAPRPWNYPSDDTIAHSAFDESIIRQQPAYYIGFWKAWWAQNKGNLSN